MKKLFLFMMISIDGYFEGPNHDLSWHNVDEEFNNTFAIDQLREIGTIIMGHRTYDLMKDYWPSEEARKDDPIVAELMNNTPKVVFSKTLEKVEESEHWKNVRLLHEVDPATINKMKKESEKDLAIFGSNNLTVSFIEKGLINEFRIMVNPVAIGKGTPLFFGLGKELKLKLVKTREFKNGNILLTYQPLL